MDAPIRQYPRFAWSESRDQTFRECRRRYYWSVYGGYNGWRSLAPHEAKLAWRLARLVPSWVVALGTTVHVRAMECVAACLAGRPLPKFEILRRASGGDLNRLFVTSRRQLDRFHRDPRRWPALADAYYGEPWDAEEVARTSARLDLTLDRLLDQTWLWDAIRQAAPGDTILPDRFYQFELLPDHITVFAAPDLLLRRRPAAPMEILDFKIGRSDGAVDQLLTYTLAVRDGLGIAPVNGSYHIGVVSLGTQTDRGGSDADGVPATAACLVSDAEVDAAAMRIRENVTVMRGLLADPVRNVPLGIEAYPRTEQRWRCPRCCYRGLCEPEAFPAEGTQP